MLRYISTICMLVAISGCMMTQAERATEVQAQVDDMIKVYGPGCEKLGFAKDTDPWRECILRLRAHDDLYIPRPSRTTITNCVRQRSSSTCFSY
jgi:hypothetical protein